MSIVDRVFSWLASDGSRQAPALVGRNDPCPCGSGLKFKKCCLDSNEAAHRRSRAVSCGSN